MSKISIIDLEIFCRVGVTEEERAKPQRLLVIVDMDFDFTSAALSDRLGRTIDYFEVSQCLLKFGERRSWKLIETLATDMANAILSEHHPEIVTVEVKKFAIPQARYVSTTVVRQRAVRDDLRRPWWWPRW